MPYRRISRPQSLRRYGMGALTLPQAIFRQEGSTDAQGNWVTSSLGYRLNNPGNLNYAGQPGCHPTTLGNGMEAQCDSLQDGIDATNRQLALDASRGLTLQQRLSTWATGNPSAYVANVASWMGVDPNTPLSVVLAGDQGGAAPPSPVDPSSDQTVYDAGMMPDSSDSLSGTAWLGIAAAALGAVYMFSR